MLKTVLTPDNADFGFTKVRISKRRTRLAYDLWCDSLGKERKKDIKPFVMICNFIEGEDKEEWLSISIDSPPQVISGTIDCFVDICMVFEYINKHKDILMKHWNGEIDDLDLYQYLR